jgi:hypothetical protein
MNASTLRAPRCRTFQAAVLAAVLGHAASVGANEDDIEFVAEHLPEAAMDNRYAALPVWSSAEESGETWSFSGQAAYASTSTGNLKNAGPMFAVGLSRQLSSRWDLGFFGFVDTLTLSGDDDYRPLQTLFSPNTPISRPVDARFEDLYGQMRHYGVGFHLSMSADNGWLGAHRWTGGLLWERVELRDYRLNYQVLGGDAAGVRGQIDFDADYVHLTPFLGMELPRSWTRWSIAPHVLIAWPVPRRGMVGHITGPGFDLHGDTEDVGEGKHFGDPSLTIGLDVTYLPAHFTIDVGTLLTQRFLEPLIHDGVEENWLLSCQWRY